MSVKIYWTIFSSVILSENNLKKWVNRYGSQLTTTMLNCIVIREGREKTAIYFNWSLTRLVNGQIDCLVKC